MPYRKKKRLPNTKGSAPTANQEGAVEGGTEGAHAAKTVSWSGILSVGGKQNRDNDERPSKNVTFDNAENGGDNDANGGYDRDNGTSARQDELIDADPQQQKPLAEGLRDFDNVAATNDGESGALLSTTELHTADVHIQRPAGDVRMVRRPNDYQPSESERTKVEKRLPEDTFSMVMIEPVKSQPFWYGMIVSFFQFATYVLVLVDVTDMNNSVNPFGFPANVDVAVRIAEVIALIILIPLQDEIIEGMILINDGYQKEALESKFHGVSRQKYILSLVLRLTVGTLSIATSFLLIMIESQVLEIFFNFIALQFVNDLDNTAFRLATEGIIGAQVQSCAIEVSDTSYFTDRRFKRKWPLFLVFFLVLGGWIWVVVLQLTGKFVSQSVEVQFGDDLDPALATFSGIYDRESRPSKSGRFHYMHRLKREHGEARAFFGYCEDLEAWTFTYAGTDPCQYRVMSAKTDSYEISESVLWGISPSGPGKTVIPLDPFYMNVFEAAGGKENPCFNGGYLKDASCVCVGDWFGRRCESIPPCPHLKLDTSHEDYQGPKDLPEDYYWLQRKNEEYVTLYEKPVYVDRILGGVILFNGRRWYFTSLPGLNVSSLDSLPTLFQDGLQLFDKAPLALFISEPSDIGTLTDRSSPLLFHWFRARVPLFPGQVQRPSLEEKASATFDCAFCIVPGYPCQFGNPCIDNKCNCTDGSSGHLCQIIPFGNGYCDDAFNTWDFSFDQGDCCQASCQSTDEFFCGYEGRVNVGFPKCVDNAYSCPDGESCWSVRTAEHQLLLVRGGVKQRTTVAELSDNGRVMIICFPRASLCQMFDQIDSTWVQRGIDIPGPRDSSFGYSVAISSPHGSILDYIVGPVDIRVAFGGRPASVNSSTYYVFVFERIAESFEFPQAPIQIPYSGAFLNQSEGNIFFDFLLHGKLLAIQDSNATLTIRDVEDSNKEVASVSCDRLGMACLMGSFRSVSEYGSFLVESTSSELFHVYGDTGDISQTNWTAVSIFSPSTTLEWAEMSKDGSIIGTFTAATNFQFFVLQDDRISWQPLGRNFSADQGWTFLNGVTSLSTDGLTAAFGFSANYFGEELHEIKVFRYNNGSSTWNQIGNDISSTGFPVISSSYDVSGLIVSDNSGYLRTFHYSPVCPPHEFYLRMFVLLLKDQAFKWTLRLDSSPEVLRASPSYEPLGLFRKVVEEFCIPREQCVALETTSYSAIPNSTASFPESLFYVAVDNEQKVYRVVGNGTYSFGKC